VDETIKVIVARGSLTRPKVVVKVMLGETNLLFLVEDVLLRILPFCGIPGVLAASQVCLSVRRSDSNFQRETWIRHVDTSTPLHSTSRFG
jgi:hypothetical protein